jgi:hypothetical protein
VRRVVVFLLALTVLAPIAVNASTLYRCGHAGELRDHCCCAHKPAQRDAARAEVRAGCCCETVQIDAVRGAHRQPASVAASTAAPGPALVTIAIAEATPRIVAFERPRDALAPPTPLFVTHCALLL